MPRRPVARKITNGRPVKEIDWNLVDQLLMAGCHGTEIAPHFDMHIKTFYDRVLIDRGVSFTEYSAEKKCKGDALLRNVQYSKALKGDNTLLIWLGKNRLTQRDTPIEVASAVPHQGQIDKDDIIMKLTSELAELKKQIESNADK